MQRIISKTPNIISSLEQKELNETLAPCFCSNILANIFFLFFFRRSIICMEALEILLTLAPFEYYLLFYDFRKREN